MKHLKYFKNTKNQNENFDWTDEDFDYDEEDDNYSDDGYIKNKFPKFYRFLVDNNILNKYIFNIVNVEYPDYHKKYLYRNVKEFIDNHNYDDLIDFAFTWSDASEGDEFWEDIDTLWKRLPKMMESVDIDFDWNDEDFDEEEIDDSWRIVDFSINGFIKNQFYILTKTIDEYNIVLYNEQYYSSGSSGEKSKPVNTIYKETSKEDLNKIFNDKIKIKVYDYHGRSHKHYDDVYFKVLPEDVKEKLR